MFDNVSSMVNEELKEQFDRLSWDLPVENLNGAEFVWLNQLQQQSVNEFHRVLREDLGLENWRIRLKFANCIQQLNKLSE